MTDIATDAARVDGPRQALGWTELGFFFVFMGIATFAAATISQGLQILLMSFTTMSTPDRVSILLGLNSLRLALTAAAMLIGIYFAMRRFPDALRTLGIRQADPDWYMVAAFGWTAIVGLGGYGLGALGQEIFGSGMMFGTPNRPGGSTSSNLTALDRIIFGTGFVIVATTTEVAYRGLLFGALRNVWGARRAAVAAAVLGTSLVTVVGLQWGMAPTIAVSIAGSLFNCWLAVRAQSILPGTVALVIAAVAVLAITGTR